MQFCLGVIPKTATGCHWNSIELFFYAFLPQIYQFLSQYYIYNKITTKYESWDSDLSNDMYFVKIIKSFDSKRP